jgi:hypothetical protein
MKAFLKQMADMQFKDNFELYFENQEQYFLVWLILLQCKWDNEQLEAKIEKFKRHVSTSFCLKMRKIKILNRKLTFFLLTI